MTKLNAQQQLAVTTTDGPLCIIAGAGSGKTAVIVQKIVYLMTKMAVPGHRICAITFTRKAAQEMIERIHQVMPAIEHRIHFSTYHALCAKILRFSLIHAQYKKNFLIIDTNQQQSIIKKIIKTQWQPNDKLERKTINQAINRISFYKKRNLDYGAVAQTFADDYLVLNHITRYPMARIYELYEKYKLDNNYLDYSDLIMHTNILFQKHPEVLKEWQNRFDYFLVDEFQDTDLVQFNFIKLLCSKHNNITVVGDPDQAIYSWRGAQPNLLNNFVSYFPTAKIIILEENYRSTEYILELANSFILHNLNRVDKKLITQNSKGSAPVVVAAPSVQAECAWIAQQIQSLVSAHKQGQPHGLALSDITILYRANYLSRPLEETLRHLNINYEVVGDFKFWRRKEILDCLAILSLIAQPNDYVALERILLQTPTIGQVRAAKILHFLQIHKLTFFELLADYLDQLSVAIQNALLTWQKAFSGLQINDITSLKTLMLPILQQIKWINSTDNTVRNDLEQTNISEFINALQEFDAANLSETPGSDVIHNFLDAIYIDPESDSSASTLQNKVRLMTVHRAKGIESAAVFIFGVNEGIMPNFRSVQNNDVSEERRIFYVAMTRAKQHLFITYNEGYNYELHTNNQRSQFIDELNAEYYQFEQLSSDPQYLSEDSLLGTWAHPQKINTSHRVGVRLKHPLYGYGVVEMILSKTIYVVLFDDANFGRRPINIKNVNIKFFTE